MIRLTLLLLMSVIFGATGISVSAADPCLSCHQNKTAGIVDHWKGSAHARAKVGCSDCHGSDVEANHKQTVQVDAAKCGSCHKKALQEHSMSKHWIGLKTGRGCTRSMKETPEQLKTCTFCHDPGTGRPLRNTDCAMFLAQSNEMQRQGCDSCHRVENRCDTCHTKHGTDVALAGLPGTCGTCHMGPDHAQYEMWEASTHGVIYKKRGEKEGPSCRTCHMSGGSHNVSRGIATGLPDSSELKKQERAYMTAICSGCHTAMFAGRSLSDADNIELQSRKLVYEAKGIIEELEKDGLLLPSTKHRAAHPVFGKNFVIGPHMLYENISGIESRFFKMAQFHYMSAFKGAFHQNPDYAHWYGNAPLKLTLSEIKSEALLLRKIDMLQRRFENSLSGRGRNVPEAADVKQLLRELKDLHLKGGLTEKEYQERKDKILRQEGL